MPGDLATGRLLERDAPLGGDFGALGEGVVNTGLGNADDAGDGRLSAEDISGTPKGINSKIAHDGNGIDFSMAKSIEIAMGRTIENPISLVAMQTYGERVRLAREHARLSQAQLGKAIGGLKQPSILAIEKRETKSKYTLDIARITGVRAEWLESGEGQMIARDQQPKPPAVDIQERLTDPELNIQQWRRDVRVLGLASCGEDGLFELNGQILDLVPRPPRLVGVKNAYALYVDGESMVPWRKPGQLVYVHPDMPPNIGDYVVVEMHPDKKGETVRRAYIKLLVRRTADKLVLEQYRPAEQISLPMKRVRAIHRVVDWSELLGI